MFKNKKSIIWLITVIATAILIVTHFDFIVGCINKIIYILEPFMYGAIIAWLLTPLCNLIQNFIYKHIKNQKKKEKISNIQSIILAETFFILIVIAIMFIIIPNLIDGITNIINSLPSTWEEAEKILSTYEWVPDTILDNFADFEEMIKDYIANIAIDKGDILVTGIFLGTKQTVLYVFDIVFGVMISIFILYSRKDFAKQSKHMLYAFFKPETVEFILEELKIANKKFSGFFAGKILDSVIVGIACFIILSIMKMPYTAMVSLIVGITNIIPIVGPFIGAIPSIIIIFSVSPIKSLYFAIFILILQQIDGHAIGPKCIGDKTGLNTFWVLFAIVFFGRLLGILGMLIGVPLFAVIHDMVSQFITMRLKQRNIEIED